MPLEPAQLQILMYPDPALRAQTSPVDPLDPVVQAIVPRMMELMFQSNGAGLAAPQVGLPWRLFVTRDPENEEKAIAWLNPELEFLDSPIECDHEGCLSLPGITVEVRRPARIRLTAQSLDGSSVECTDESLFRVVQHEYDHLEGVLIIDKMSTMERIRNRKTIKQLKVAARNSSAE